MKVTLVRHTADPEGLFADAAAICVGKDRGTPAGMKSAIRSGHESLMEHASFTFLVEGISRVTLAQLTRHRHASYSVESQRYAGVQLSIVVPESMRDAAVREKVIDASDQPCLSCGVGGKNYKWRGVKDTRTGASDSCTGASGV